MSIKDFSVTASGNKVYPVNFVSDAGALLEQLSLFKNPVIVVDSIVVRSYPELIEAFKKIGTVTAISATEDNKTLQGATDILTALAESGATRHTTVIAVGGGIVQDIVSFAAHIYYRGLNFVFVPTTLLAMCDSCIGGKCGVNFNGYKNQLGAFHPPGKVIIWDGFLASLPDEALYSGYGEILKLMLIGENENFDSFKRLFVHEGVKNTKTLEYIRQGLLIKKRFIEEDEFDNGVRWILNYGHTFGHAIELATDYRVPHGIAVAYGIDIANYIAVRKGVLPEATMSEIHDLIYSLFKFDVFSGVTAENLLESVRRDKKVMKGGIGMVLLERVGHFKIQTILIDKYLGDIVRDYLEHSVAVCS